MSLLQKTTVWLCSQKVHPTSQTDPQILHLPHHTHGVVRTKEVLLLKEVWQNHLTLQILSKRITCGHSLVLGPALGEGKWFSMDSNVLALRSHWFCCSAETCLWVKQRVESGESASVSFPQQKFLSRSQKARHFSTQIQRKIIQHNKTHGNKDGYR